MPADRTHIDSPIEAFVFKESKRSKCGKFLRVVILDRKSGETLVAVLGVKGVGAIACEQERKAHQVDAHGLKDWILPHHLGNENGLTPRRLIRGNPEWMDERGDLIT